MYAGPFKKLLRSLPQSIGHLKRKLSYIPAVPASRRPRRSNFHEHSTADDVTAGLDLSGKNILITGCNSGLGLETMRTLTLRGARIFGAARTIEAAKAACASVPGNATPLAIELTNVHTILNAVEQLRSLNQPLDALILNAGVMQLQELERVEGLEKQFFVNHLGHFLLTNGVLPLLAKSDEARVVTLSSRAYTWAPSVGIDFENLDGSKSYNPRTAYGQSKLANALFTRELAKRFHGDGILSNAVHPGVIEETGLHRHLPISERQYSADSNPGYTIKTLPEGAATTCYVAVHPDLRGVTGYYFADCNWEIPAPIMQDDRLARQLWAFSDSKAACYLERYSCALR